MQLNDCQELLEKLITLHQPNKWDVFEHPFILVLFSGLFLAGFFWWLDGKRMQRKEKIEAAHYIMVTATRIRNYIFEAYLAKLRYLEIHFRLLSSGNDPDSVWGNSEFVTFYNQHVHYAQKFFEVDEFAVVITKIHIYFSENCFETWRRIHHRVAEIADEVVSMNMNEIPTEVEYRDKKNELLEEMRLAMNLMANELSQKK